MANCACVLSRWHHLKNNRKPVKLNMASKPTFNNRRSPDTTRSTDAASQPFMRRRIVVLGVSVAAAVFACAGVLLAWRIWLAPQTHSDGSVSQAAPLMQSISNVSYTGDFTHLRPQDLQLFSNSIRGNIWSVDLNEIRDAAQAYPWVRSAEVRRQFPDGLKIHLEEHKPFAKWGEGEYSFVNTFGEVFEISPSALKPSSKLVNSNVKMPVFIGPTGTAPDIVKHWQWLQTQFVPLGRQVAEVRLTVRGALRVRDNKGTVVELGRAQVEERLQRVLSAWPHVSAMQQPNMHIDARYPSGLALSVNTAPAIVVEPEPAVLDLPPSESEKVVLNTQASKIENMLAPQMKATGIIR
jgi:cell division protein FtsQ